MHQCSNLWVVDHLPYVILEYLDCEEVDCEKIIMDFVTQLPEELLVSIRAWKGNELNGDKGRGFTKLVLALESIRLHTKGI